MDRFERKIETFLAKGRQRYALVLMTIVPIQRLSGSRWVPLFRQLSDLDDDLYAFIEAGGGARAAGPRERARRPARGVARGRHAARRPGGSRRPDHDPDRRPRHDRPGAGLGACRDRCPREVVLDRLTDELAPRHRRRAARGRAPAEAGVPRRGDPREPSAAPGCPFVVRKTVRPFEAGGRDYPAGVILCPCSYLVHRREDLYPEPDRFRPERFLERKFGPHEWFPFGGGNRVCLGMPFALYEMKVLLATLLSQVRLARPAGARSRARRYGIRPGAGRRGSADLAGINPLTANARPASTVAPLVCRLTLHQA